jgi:hypothetical protein
MIATPRPASTRPSSSPAIGRCKPGSRQVARRLHWAPDHKLTGNVCAAYIFFEGRSNIYVCANSINDSKYNYNNLAAYYATYYHKFGHSKWHMAWETWYQYMKNTPNVNNPAAASSTHHQLKRCGL